MVLWNKAYRPNAHLLDTFMQTKISICKLGPDSEFQSNDCLQCCLYICVQYLETKFNKETYMNGHN